MQNLKRYSDTQWLEEVKRRRKKSDKLDRIEKQRIARMNRGVGVKTILRKKNKDDSLAPRGLVQDPTVS